MTEIEKTELAMKAAANATKPSPIQDSKVPKPPAKETKKPKVEKPKVDTFKVGGKDISLAPWNGKTKKKTKKIFEFVERLQDVDFEAVLEVLIYDQVKEDILFDENEIKLLLLKLKEISIGKDIEFDVECENCGEENTINTDTSKYEYTPSTLPFEFNDDIKFVVPSKSEYEKNVLEITNAEDYDGITTKEDINMTSRIKIEGKDVNFVIDYLDNAPLKDVGDVITNLKEHLSKFNMTESFSCKTCKAKNTVDVEIMTGIFEELVK